MDRATELAELRRALDPPAPREPTIAAWRRRAEREEAAGDLAFAALDYERAGDASRAHRVWWRLVAQGPSRAGWPAIAFALARVGRALEAKEAWNREARLRASQGDWLRVALARGLSGEPAAERAAWIARARAAADTGEHWLACRAWAMAGDPLHAAEAARQEAVQAGRRMRLRVAEAMGEERGQGPAG